MIDPSYKWEPWCLDCHHFTCPSDCGACRRCNETPACYCDDPGVLVCDVCSPIATPEQVQTCAKVATVLGPGVVSTTGLKFYGNFVPGVGPKPATAAFVGEAPGAEEDEEGQPFVGLSGIVAFDTHLERFGIPRHMVYITNLYKRRPSLQNDDPTPEQIEEGMRALLPELQEVCPEVIVCVGRLSAKAVLGDRFTTMDMMHGVPVFCPDLQWHPDGYCWVLPINHPAHGLHRAAAMEDVVNDLKVAAALIKMGPEQRHEAHYKVHSPGLESEPDYRQLEKGEHPTIFSGAGIDTEGMPGQMWCLSWSNGEGHGRVSREPVQLPHTVVIQNAPWDMKVLDQAGYKLPPHIIDPMVYAYALQDEPQGLKEGAYKHRGKIRKDFNETVEPYYTKALWAWVSAEHAHQKLIVESLIESELMTWREENPTKKVTKKLQADIKRKLKGLDLPFTKLYTKLDSAWTDFDKGKTVKLRDRIETIEPEVMAVALNPLPKYDLGVVDHDTMVDYTCSDADDALYLCHYYKRRAIQEGVETAANLTMGMIPLVHRMQKVGLPVDIEACQSLQAQLEGEAILKSQDLYELAGREFNPGSPDEVAHILSNLMYAAHLNMDMVPKTESGARMSTDVQAIDVIQRMIREVVESGRGDSPDLIRVRDFCRRAQEHRGILKMRNTYVDWILEGAMSNPAHRLFFDLKHTRVYSGRLAGKVLTFPRDQRIRSLFKAGPGRAIVAVDLSQIEPRVAAHRSQDPELLRVYREKRDWYTETAMAITRMPREKCGKGTEMRQAFKVIDLAMLYLIMPGSLMDNLYLACADEPDAKKSEELYRLVDGYGLQGIKGVHTDWRKLYARAMEYAAETCVRAKQHDGWATDLWGRRRLLGNLYLRENYNAYSRFINRELRRMREKAEKECWNLDIQGSAQGIEQTGCIETWSEVIVPLQDQGIYCEPLLQVHDELVVEVDQDWAEYVRLKVIEIMERSSSWMTVPVVAEGKVGQTWADAK